MSRYTLTCYDNTHTCVVGYDSPLKTFFAQVKSKNAAFLNNQCVEFDCDDENDDQDEDGKLILWIGTSLYEITDLKELKKAVSGYTDIHDEILHKLEADQLKDGTNQKGNQVINKQIAKYYETMMDLCNFQVVKRYFRAPQTEIYQVIIVNGEYSLQDLAALLVESTNNSFSKREIEKLFDSEIPLYRTKTVKSR